MMRTLLAVGAVVGIWAVAASAPAPKDRLFPYAPTRIGDTAIYEISANGKEQEMTEQVTGVERKGREIVITTTTQINNRKSVTNRYSYSDEGLFRLTLGAREYDPPLCLLKLPARPGLKWEGTDWLTKGGERAMTYTIKDVEEIEVPAGKFKAIRVETESKQSENNVTRSTTWYAPGVGPVKTVSQVRTFEMVRVLKSFTPGKD
jgi:hypothetical protein